MNETQIIENIVPLSFQDAIEAELLKNNFFPWFYNPSTSSSSFNYEYNGIGNDKNAIDSPQLYHLMVNKETGVTPSPYYNFIFPIFYFLEEKTGIKVKDVTRIKANLLIPFNGPAGGIHFPHIDQEIPGTKTLIYYVVDSDGDTHTYNEYFDGNKQSNFTIEKKITPKKGRAVLLDTMRFHASSLPVNYNTRCVLNFVFKI